MLEEVNVALVILDKKSQHILSGDDTLQLTALVRCQSDSVVSILVQHVDSTENLFIDIQVDQLAPLVVGALQAVKAA